LLKQTAIRVAQIATQQKKQKRGSCQAPLFALMAHLIRCKVTRGWRFMRVRCFLMARSVVMLAGVTIDVVSMSVV
jgi:hypothetical protein